MPGSTYPDEETPLNGENPKLSPGSEMQNSVESENLLKGRPSLQDIAWRVSTTKKASGRLFELSRYGAALQKGFSSGFHSFVDSANGFRFAVSCLVVYYASAIIAFSHMFENWSYIDSMYFATITFLTIGYGDVSPSTDAGRLFTVFFAIFGIFILGIFLGDLGKRIVDVETKAYDTMKEKARNNIKAMFSMQIDEEAEKHEPKTAAELIFRVIRVELPLLAIIFLVGILYGTQVENWTIIESIYFSTITFSTVGFGDFTPQQPLVRVFCTLILPVVVATFCEMIGRVASAYLQYKLHAEEKKFLSRQLTKADLKLMDTDKDGQVSYGEFLHFMLLAMQKVDEEDLLDIKAAFDKLDKTKRGCLTKDDISGTVGLRQKASRSPMDGVA